LTGQLESLEALIFFVGEEINTSFQKIGTENNLGKGKTRRSFERKGKPLGDVKFMGVEKFFDMTF